MCSCELSLALAEVFFGKLCVHVHGQQSFTSDKFALHANNQPSFAKEYGLCSLPAQMARRTITLGSDFSGMGTVSIGAAKCCEGLDIDVSTLFTSDKARGPKKFLQRNVAPERHYMDIVTREEHDMPSVDTYSFTSECDSFSANGTGKGLEDPKGVLILFPLSYIRKCMPITIMSENSPLLLSKFKYVSDVLVAELSELGYLVQVGMMKTSDFRIPQNRKRWYLIGIRADCYRQRDCHAVPFFPAPLGSMLRLVDLITPLPLEKRKALPEAEAGTSQKKAKRELFNVSSGIMKAVQAGVNPCIEPVIIDTGCSPSHRVSAFGGLAPTLTKTRCCSQRYWCTTKGGFLSVDELALLQGFDPNRDYVWRDVVKPTAMGKMLGNAQSLNVIMALLPHMWYLAKLISYEEFVFMKGKL